MSWFSGYGSRPTLSEEERDLSHLDGSNGPRYDGVTGITGSSAQDIYKKYQASGATKEQLQDLVKRIGR